MTTTTMQTNTGYLEHKYGDNYHILDDVFLHSHLANLSKDKTKQPVINYIVAALYTHLIKEVINNEFPQKQDTVRTRMANIDERGYWTGRVVEPETRAIVVDIARAGTLPGEICFKTLNQTLNPDLVRQDHLYMARKTDENNQVVGVTLSGSKIGGDVDEAIVLIPDPMGATGGSISKAINHYKETVKGKALKFITMHLIVTPDYIKRIKQDHPELIVYGLRLDRGASSEAALRAQPGELLEEESGLTDHQYILPGAGGLGEIMNNSFC
ncbi:MAG: uracil phosphoribosyltransferase [Candidatus Melainabacteria bacterium]|jgi:uracil phosphoribosyltransferase|nr:uracil phosphoribosyltransferase [Candidatus Melainabacteria bacterium]